MHNLRSIRVLEFSELLELPFRVYFYPFFTQDQTWVTLVHIDLPIFLALVVTFACNSFSLEFDCVIVICFVVLTACVRQLNDPNRAETSSLYSG